MFSIQFKVTLNKFIQNYSILCFTTYLLNEKRLQNYKLYLKKTTNYYYCDIFPLFS